MSSSEQKSDLDRSSLSELGRRRFSTTATLLNLSVAFFLVAFANGPLWNALSVALGKTHGHWIPQLLFGVALVLLFNCLLSLGSIPRLHKPLLIGVLVVAAVANYYMSSYHIVIDDQMITNVFETDFHEASEQISWALLRRLALFGVFPAVLVLFTKIRYRPWRRELLVRSGVFALSAGILGTLVLANLKVLLLFGREHRDLRMYVNPTYPIYSLVKTVRGRYRARHTEPLRAVGTDARKTASGPTAVVYVIGETARAEQFSLNGYHRQTNPNLATRNVISFEDVRSCGTATAYSLPGMFSHLSGRDYSPADARKYENLLDVLKRAGVEVFWRDNNSGSKGIADRVHYESVSSVIDVPPPESSECYDEMLLTNLDELLQANKGDLLIVLHQKGSHGPSYYKRVPKQFKVFLPECDREDIQNCDQQSLINAYDNTIVYTDYVLSRLIDLLAAQGYPTAMLYVSDHGESLGEKNIYLHGLPPMIAPRQQTQVPMIFWASTQFYDVKGIDQRKLAASRSNPYSHGNLFHSVLGLFDVQTAIYRTDLDIFQSARKFAPAP